MKDEKVETKKEQPNVPQLGADEVCFWAPSSRYQLGNFRKEQRNSAGMVVSPEEPIEFTNNLFVTDVKAKIKFIKSSDPFKNGQIKLCESLQEGRMLTATRNRAKAVTVISSEDATNHQYSEQNLSKIMSTEGK